MVEKALNDLPTVKIKGSKALAMADGRIALALYTEKGDAIALEITPKAIEVLRRDLRDLETYLSRQPGSA